MRADRPALELGLFMPNCSNMPAISTYRTVDDEWPFEANRRIALAAEAAGFDLLFPVSRWRGFGGTTDYLGTSLETMTWAAGLLAVTQRIKIFSTVHVPMFHPVAVAKMGATLDHISNGRWGLNLVSGWSREEFAMMGIELLPHGERYQRTTAFIEILKGLWTEPPGTFSHHSTWYHVEGGYSLPQPLQRPHPPIANAGISPEAREMMAALCDWAFISPPSVDATAAITTDLAARAAAHGRRLRCAGFPFVLWRDTADEAEDEVRRIIAAKDEVAAANWLAGVGIGSGSFDQFTLDMMVLGAGALPLVGTAEDVAQKLKTLYDNGLDAVLMVFQAYHDDTLRFARDIMPLLRDLQVIGPAAREE